MPADTAGVVNLAAVPGNYLAIAVPPDQNVLSPSADFLRIAQSFATNVTLVPNQKAVVVIPFTAAIPR